MMGIISKAKGKSKTKGFNEEDYTYRHGLFLCGGGVSG